jgi:4-hydroxymandelate oxidase
MNPTKAALSAEDLRTLQNLDEFEELAKAHLPLMAYEYLAAGVADEWTARENRAAFERLRLRQRVGIDVSRIDTTSTLFGRTHDFPILLAPCGFQKLFHPEGESAVVAGANRAGATFVTATFASISLEQTAAQSQAPLWFQLYIQPDRNFTRDLVERVEVAGYEALVVTLDVPVNGPRYRELRAGFRLPPGVERVNLEPLGEVARKASHRPHGRQIYSGVRAPDVTWNDIAWIKSFAGIPVIVKGILEPEDAAIAIENGADGIYVSNHGGRSVDGLPASIDALPGVAERVTGKVPVLFDGGIRRGTDVFKALALGASAVLIGRPYLFALAAAGDAGVARAIEILRTELEMTMGLLGVTSLRDIGKGVCARSS